jgi:hypothetical protein
MGGTTVWWFNLKVNKNMLPFVISEKFEDAKDVMV